VNESNVAEIQIDVSHTGIKKKFMNQRKKETLKANG
jgi:hypothetical protein